MKILALDIGTVRIGIATSDIMEIIASAYEVYRRKFLKADVSHVAEIVKNLEVGEVVIGLPLNMDGTEGPRVEVTREFGNALKEASGLDIIYVDA